MLKDQLLELQQSRRTLLNANKSAISFIDDDSIDTNTLLDILQFKSDFTTSKALKFDRHRLSEKEEKRFNKKFSLFLRNLLTKMNDSQIDILLEFLLRVYNIDTFNQRELQFLLLPFQKYFGQLTILNSRRVCPLSDMKSYSYSFIASAILKDDFLQLDFEQYCANYLLFKEFIDKVLDLIIEKIKNSVHEHINFLFQILKILIDTNHAEKAIEIYSSLHELKSCPEVSSLFDSFKLPSNNCATSYGEYETIFNDRKGRLLINDMFKLCKYLEFLEANCLIPFEFNSNEFNLLRNIFLKKDYKISNYNDVTDLYNEMDSKLEINRYLTGNNIYSLYKGELIMLTSENFDINLFTSENYTYLLHNMSEDLITIKSFDILCKCLAFKSFSPEFFFNFVFKSNLTNDLILKLLDLEANECDSLIRLNIYKFIDFSNYDLTTYLINKNLQTDITVLTFILTSDRDLNEVEIIKIIDITMHHNKPILITNLINFICKNQKKLPIDFNIDGFCMWAISNGYISYLEPIIHMFSALISTEIHFKFLTQTGFQGSIAVLESRNFDFVSQLFNLEQFDLLIDISKLRGLEYILIEHPKAMELVEKYHKKLVDNSYQVCLFLINHIFDQRAIRLLVEYSSLLIHFRSHKYWPEVKIILLESISLKAQYQSICNFVIDNMIQFDESDCDLFEAIFDKSIKLDLSSFQKLPNTNGSATFVDMYIKNSKDDLVSVLPIISPLLINFKKNSIVVLFEKYQNIMITYAKHIIVGFPENSHVLVNLEPKIILRELCNNFTNKIVGTLISILNTCSCNSRDILSKVIKCYIANANIMFDYSYLVTFIKFYQRSFVQECIDLLYSFVEFVYDSNAKLLLSVAKETLQSSSSIYKVIVSKIENQILTNSLICQFESLEFMCDFLEIKKFVFKEPFSLFDLIYELKDNNSARLCSYILKNEPEIMKDKINFLISKLDDRINLDFVLKTISLILKNCDECDSYKHEILTHIVLLSEDQNQDICSQAIQLLELLQN